MLHVSYLKFVAKILLFRVGGGLNFEHCKKIKFSTHLDLTPIIKIYLHYHALVIL